MELGIINRPELVGYDHNMKICLMRDMGGCDLYLLPQLNMDTALNMFISLSRIQKDSIRYVASEGFFGVDYRIGTMLNDLLDLPETSYEMLFDTPYRITQYELARLKQNVEHVKTVLESIHNSHLPDTIHHGDLCTYNTRIVDGECIFYDWGCGGVSHPFFDTFRLMYTIRGKLPTDISAKEIIIDTYLREWSEYGNHNELKNIFNAIDGLARFYMAYVKYIRTRNLHMAYAVKPDAFIDDLGMDRRYATASVNLKEFIEYVY